MNEKGTFAATLLDAGGRGLSALVVEQARARCEDREVGALLAAPEAISDAEQRLRYLAEAAAAGTPDLFAAHVEWSRVTSSGRGVTPAFVAAIVAALAEVLERELAPEAWTELQPSLLAGRAVLSRPLAVPSSLLDAKAGLPSPLESGARKFLLALLEGRRADALQLIEQAVTSGTPIADLQHHVVGAALAEVGRMWQAAEAHVGEERLSSSIVGDALALLRRHARCRPPLGRRVLVASVEGNLHDLGAHMVADRLEIDGWTTFFLGANVPTADLLRSAVDHDVDVLALSAGLGIHVRAAARAVAAAHAREPRRLPVVIGGRIFNQVTDLWRAVGADAFAAGPEEVSATCLRLTEF